MKRSRWLKAERIRPPAADGYVDSRDTATTTELRAHPLNSLDQTLNPKLFNIFPLHSNDIYIIIVIDS